MFYQSQTARRPPKGPKECRFCPWWSWSLTFDLDLQTRPSEGPNTSSALPNINRTQTAERRSHFARAVCALQSPPPGSDEMIPSAAAWPYLQPARYNAFSVGRKFVPGDLDLWPSQRAFYLILSYLACDSDIQTHPSERPNTSSMWLWRKSAQWFPRYFIHKQTNKEVTTSSKTEPSAVHYHSPKLHRVHADAARDRHTDTHRRPWSVTTIAYISRRLYDSRKM